LTGKANPNLQPEKITTYELVYDQYFGRHLRSSLSGFYYQCRELIVQTMDPTDGLAMFSNIGKVEAKGIEAELLGAWANGLQGRLSYSYQNARNSETDTPLVNSPHHLAKFNLTLPLYAGKLFLSPEIQYYGPRTTVAGGTAGGFIVSNLTLFSKDLLPGLELSGSVYNLFDKQYGDPTPGLPQNRQDVLGQDGRTFRVKITYRF
jgi:iron complex outermembrane receptor protein